MQNKVARIINEQAEDGDHGVIDALRQLAGMHIREVQAQQHFTRVRVVDIQRDQFGNVTGSQEHIEEHESGDSFSAWAK